MIVPARKGLLRASLATALAVCMAVAIATRSRRAERASPAPVAEDDAGTESGREVPAGAQAASSEGTTVRGRVVRASEPVEGARVSLEPWGTASRAPAARASAEPWQAATGPDGRFEVRGVPPGSIFRIVVDAPPSALHFQAGSSPEDGGDALDLGDIALQRPERLQVRLLGPDGEPLSESELSGAEVSAHASRKLERKGGSLFVLERAEPGAYAIDVVASCFARASQRVSLPRTAPFTIRLAAGRRIGGRILTAGGDPIEGAAVAASIHDLGGPSLKVCTDAGGRFVFDELPDGEVSLLLEAKGFATSCSTWRAGIDDLELRLLPEGKIAGRVVSAEDGSPIEGAGVCATGAGCWSADAVTDAEGRFDVRGLAPGTYQVEGEARGFVPSVVGPVGVSSGGKVDGVEIRLARGLSIAGNVVDSGTGLPIGGAQVWLQSGRLSALTGQDGSFELAGLEAGIHGIDASARGWIRGRHGGIVMPAEGPTVLALDRALAAGGRVLDPEGKPLAGAMVEIRLAPPRHVDVSSRPSEADREGRFRIEGLEPAPECVAVAWHEKHPPGLSAPFPLVAGRDAEGIVIRLARGGSIEGRVLDEDGRGVEGVWVGASPLREESADGDDAALRRNPLTTWLHGGADFSLVRGATTGPRGEYRIPQLGAGRYAVRVEPEGPWLADVVGWVEVIEGQSARCADLFRLRGATLSGTVLDPQRKPIAGAAVATSVGKVTAGRDGRFRIQGLAPEARLSITARAPGYSPLAIEAADVGADLAIVLEPAAAVKGRVWARGGAGFEEGHVDVRPWGETPGAGISFDGSRDGPDIDLAGRFRFELAAGGHTLTFHVPGYLPVVRETLVAPGEEIEDLEVELLPGGAIHGVVVSRASGAPVRGADVEVHIGAQDFHGETWPDGSFTFEGLPSGAATVTAGGHGFGSHRVTGVVVREGETSTVRLDLPSLGRIRGIASLRGEPVAQASVCLRRLHGPEPDDPLVVDEAEETETLPGGDFEFENLDPGKYNVALGSKYEPLDLWAEETVLVEEGSVAVARLDARPIRLLGRVLCAGTPCGGATVSVVASDRGWTGGQAVADLEGRYVLHLRGSGPCLLGVSTPAGGSAFLEVLVSEKTAEAEQDLQLPSGRISGIVVDPRGRPVRWAHVEAFLPTGPFRSRICASARSVSTGSDEEGRFDLLHLPPGSYTLVVRPSGGSPCEEDVGSASALGAAVLRGVEVPEGAVGEARVLLQRAAPLRLLLEDDRGAPISEESWRQGGRWATARDLRGALLCEAGLLTEGNQLVFAGLAPGHYRIAVCHAAYAIEMLEVHLPPEGLVTPVKLEQGCSLSLRVVDSFGCAVEGAEIEVAGPGGVDPTPDICSFVGEALSSESCCVVTNESGTVLFPDLTPGTYRLRATKGAGSREDSVVLSGTEPVRMRLTIHP